tara:strand:- start:11614 stop:12588 length:975 start_codon:yes stop_codon:yes gene_type:complete
VLKVLIGKTFMIKLLEFSLSNRGFYREFESVFFNMFKVKRASNRYLGKNFSFCVAELKEKRILVLFDLDDGSGITPCRQGILDGDCKLDFSKLEKLKSDYNIENKNIIVFKAQLNRHECEYYPFKEKVYPLGYFSGNYEYIKNIQQDLKVEKDIDLLWLGTVNLDATPWNWPENQDIGMWSSGWRIKGYKLLESLKKERKDLNIVFGNKKVAKKDYFDLVSRAKICLELPGCGWFTKRFVENILLEKCILSMRQKQLLPFKLIENVHYHSMGENLDNLEKEVDNLLSNKNLISDYEENTKSIKNNYNLLNLAENVFKKINRELL